MFFTASILCSKFTSAHNALPILASISEKPPHHINLNIAYYTERLSMILDTNETLHFSFCMPFFFLYDRGISLSTISSRRENMRTH